MGTSAPPVLSFAHDGDGTARGRSAARVAPAPAHEPARPGLEAEISTRHLSFLETGRALPSRDMVLHLAEQLEVPLRERNILLVAAGFAPVFAERPLADPALQAARKAVDLVLAGHEPYPALAVDRHWTLVAANGAVGRLIAGADAAAAAAARQRAAPEPASQGAGAAHRQPARVARAPARPPAPADRGLGRPGARRLMRELAAYPAPTSTRSGRAADGPRVRRRAGAAAARHGGRHALFLQHDDGVRHARRHHAVGAGAGVVLPRRHGHRGRLAAHGRRQG